jgi:PIN domain nuclease of toxin-antitoxin system
MNRLLLDTCVFLWWQVEDRLLVAQAQVEQLVLATSDAKLRPYDVTCFWL